MKEIVFVSNFLGNGGAARVITVLAETLLKKGHRVTIVDFPFDAEEYPHAPGIDYVRLTPAHTGGARKKLDRILLLRGELKKHPGATVISFEYFMNMQTIVAAFGMKNRMIVSERNDPASMGGKRGTKTLRNLLYRFCDVLVCQTPDARDYFPEAVRRRAVVIPNPLKDGLPEAVSGERTHEVVNFCRLMKQKNLPLLLDAFADFHRTHADWRLLIYGSGRERENLEKYIADHGYGGFAVLHDAVMDIHERIRGAAMFVSSSDYEGMSNSMLEAMAIGLPTICTDCPCGGARMMIRDGENGLLTPVGDRKALCEAMTRVADDPALAQKLSVNGQKVREELSSGRIIAQWEAQIGQ